MKSAYFVLPNLKNGGGNRMFIELANTLVNDNWNVCLLHPNNSNDKLTYVIDPAVEIKSIGQYSESNLKKLLNIIRLLVHIIKNHRKHKVVISDPIISILFIVIPSRNIFRFIQADDYSIFDDKSLISKDYQLWAYKLLTRLSFKKPQIFLFNSKYVYERFLTVSNRKDVSYRLVNCAVDHKIFNNRHVRDWLTEKVSICLVGRRHPLKGLVDFINAYKLIKSKVGKYVSNVYIISHDDLSDFDLSDFKVVKPSSDFEISSYMNEAHIFISTSWLEGFGLPPLEAMSTGCACIISRSGGVNEYAKEGVNCFMYEPKNVKELASQIVQAILDKEKLIEYSQAGEVTAKDFSWGKSSDLLKRILLN